MKELTREMVEKSLSIDYDEKCPRCGHTRWMTFKDFPKDISCTRCFYMIEGILGPS